MSKITKKQYTERKQFLESKITELEIVISKLPEDFDHSQELNEKLGDFWNACHDEISDYQRQLKYLDDEWDKRNWSNQDHVNHSLVMNNID